MLWFTVWLAILYAGADHPPPSGFLWIVLLDAIAAGLAYVRIQTYHHWSKTRRPWRFLKAAGEGLLVGFAYAAFVKMLPCSGEPSVHPSWIDQVVWFVVLGIVGSLNATALHAVSSVARRLAKAS